MQTLLAFFSIYFLDTKLLIPVFILGPLLTLSSMIAWNNRHLWGSEGLFKTFFQSWAKVSIEFGLILAILGIAMAVIGITTNFRDGSGLFTTLPSALVGTCTAVICAATGYAFRNSVNAVKYRLGKIQWIFFWLITSCFIFYQIDMTDVSISNTYLQPEFVLIFFPLLCLLTYSGIRTKKSFILSAIEAIFSITMLGIVLGISSWFVNADDFSASREAIVLTGLVFFWGAWFHLLINSVSLVFPRTADSEAANLGIKTWHYCEAASFFLFLVFAPVGATEYQRESTDQANQQANNEAQELRIEQLEAQIKLLTEKVGEV